MNTINEFVLNNAAVLILAGLVVMVIMITLATVKYVTVLKEEHYLDCFASELTERENELNINTKYIDRLKEANAKEYELLVNQRLLYKDDLNKRLDLLKEIEIANKAKAEHNKKGEEIAAKFKEMTKVFDDQDEITEKAKQQDIMIALFEARGYNSPEEVLTALDNIKGKKAVKSESITDENIGMLDKDTEVKPIKKPIKKAKRKAKVNKTS